jgi:ferrous iron transport protein A
MLFLFKRLNPACHLPALLLPPPGPVMGLDQLVVNQPARVVDLASSEGEDESLLLRLMEIGFLPGESVRVVATGFPGPDPLAVRIGQATFALRRHEASQVLVQLEAAA